MSSIQERLQLKRVPVDTWNIREQLCLASAVVRSGDQNWMSVSRALKTVGEANRPADWYSQKSCAAQYGALLEHVETPKRKKRSSEGAVETPQESILKRLTQERIIEIQKTVAEMNQQYDLLKNEIAEARNQSTTDERLREMWTEIETAKRTRERETARRTAWLKEREERRARAERTWRPPTHTTPVAGAVAPPPGPGPGPGPAPASPLLTSLLKSSPVVTTPQRITHPANVVDTISPSAGAPTLSMLLERSGNTSPRESKLPLEMNPTPHENKHAAIEHIKNQLVQIEQQLKAHPGTPPLPAALDIDDIEIKAEDVYAFRDIDIQIPPVATIHKPAARVVEKPPFKKDDLEVPPPSVENIATEPVVVDIKEEPMVTEPVPEESLLVEIDVPPAAPQPSAPPSECQEDVKLVEVKFPSPEIKIVRDELKIKEEVKETEIVVEPETEQDADVNVEDIPDVEPPSEQHQTEEVSLPEEPVPPVAIPPAPAPPSPVPPTPDPPTPTIPPTSPVPLEGSEVQIEQPAVLDIPLPQSCPQGTVNEEIPSIEPPLPPEPEVTLEETKQEEEVPEEKQSEPEVVEEETVEDAKKDEDAEDSIPLKEMMREESERKSDLVLEVELKVEPPGEEEPHTETDDDTPMELSREEEKDGKKKRDYSRKKKPDSRTCSGSESAAEASAPESPASDAERQHRLWKKSVMLVYSRLCAHKYASVFQRPISDEEAPGYSLVIKRPTDLTAIRRNIEAGVIRSTAEFHREVLLMLSNALMYNNRGHAVHRMARDMHHEAMSQLGMLVAAQAHAGLTAPPPAPAPPPRRKRRRHSPPPPPADAAPPASPPTAHSKKTH